MNFFSHYLQERKDYQPLPTEEDLSLSPGLDVRDLWNKVKEPMKWEDLPEEFLVFPEDVKNWSSLYNFCKRLSEEKWDDNIKSYMAMCEREKKLLTFTFLPCQIFQRLNELVPFIMKGKPKLETGIYTVKITKETMNEKVLSWSSGKLSQSDIQSFIQYFDNQTLISTLLDGNYVGYCHFTEIVISKERGRCAKIECVYL